MCVFCKIISGELQSYKVYEDENVLAFLDIKPTNPGHVLVVPKKHHANLEEIAEADLAVLITIVKKVGRLLKDKLAVVGYNVVCNNDPIAGQVIPHLHFHVIPRHQGDGLELWHGHSCTPEEANEILNKLKS